MKENINYKLLYSIATRYYHTNNLEAAKILYEELVLEGVIPEFKFNMEVWKNDKSGKDVWKWYQVAYVQYDATLATLEEYVNAYKQQFLDCDIMIVPKLGSIAIH